MKKIKSKYIIQFLFSNLCEKRKIKIIKYNKKLQNIIDIKLNKYKFFIGKYILYEKTGKGKEYSGYSNNLFFEGEYLNRERNGNGKEYNWRGILRFEGEYLNGEKNGKGKEYYEDGKLKFEGEFIVIIWKSSSHCHLIPTNII